MGADQGRAGGGHLETAASLQLGLEGERIAARFLERRGFRVLDSRFLARRGEVDLVCRRGDRVVLVEVKTRSSDRFGAPIEAVGARKRRALLAAAGDYRALAGWRGPIEFAVVAIHVGREPELIEDAF